MIGGYAGKTAFVNLSEGSITMEEFSEKDCRDFLGGPGIAAKVLCERMKAKVDPLGPDNLLGFVTGPLTGSTAPAATRCCVAAKSPRTGTWAESFGGGYFGPELKAAGYDAVFFSGISPKPVYLWLSDGKAELRDATHLWGRDTTETVDILRQELGEGVKVACIGPAGESLSLLGAIISDKDRAAGRLGLGAVMGAKRLKAVVVRGKGKVMVADPQRLKVLRRNFIKEKSPGPYIEIYRNTLRTYGTPGLVSFNVPTGKTPIKNWALNGPEAMPTWSKIDGANLTKYEVGLSSCPHCSMACGHMMKVDKGPYAVSDGKKLEYETICSFGTMCLNDDPESIIKANDICSRYGMDTMSAGHTIAFAMECYERGVLGKEETEGIELTWGNAPAIIAILEKMAKREGFGAVLADGIGKAAERIGKGSEEWAIHIRGEDPGNCDPRYDPARGIGYLVEPLPGSHLHFGWAVMLERGNALGPYPELQPPTPKVDLYDCQNKTKGVIYATGSNYNQLLNASGACWFGVLGGLYRLPEYISAVTGWDFTMAEGLSVGRRIQTLRQLFNVSQGLSARDFYLPDRIKKPPATGPFAGLSIDFDTLRRSYYEAMGWDTETGEPTEQTCQELGLGK